MPNPKSEPVRNRREAGDGASRTWNRAMVKTAVAPNLADPTPDCRARMRTGPSTSQKAKSSTPVAPASAVVVQAPSGPEAKVVNRAGRAGMRSFGRNSGKKSKAPKAATRLNQAWGLVSSAPTRAASGQPGHTGSETAEQNGISHLARTKKTVTPARMRNKPGLRWPWAVSRYTPQQIVVRAWSCPMSRGANPRPTASPVRSQRAAARKPKSTGTSRACGCRSLTAMVQMGKYRPQASAARRPWRLAAQRIGRARTRAWNDSRTNGAAWSGTRRYTRAKSSNSGRAWPAKARHHWPVRWIE